MNYANLTGEQLNFAVAEVMGLNPRMSMSFCMVDKHRFDPLHNWAQAGPIIQEVMELDMESLLQSIVRMKAGDDDGENT